MKLKQSPPCLYRTSFVDNFKNDVVLKKSGNLGQERISIASLLNPAPGVCHVDAHPRNTHQLESILFE